MTARSGRRGPEAGVTAIETTIVVLIVGTLLAIAVPTLVGSAGHDQDQTAQGSLRAALTAADVAYAGGQSFAAAGADPLSRASTSLHYTAGQIISAGPTSISVANDADHWAAAAQSETGTCYFIAAEADGRVLYGTASDGLCTGDVARSAARRDSW